MSFPKPAATTSLETVLAAPSPTPIPELNRELLVSRIKRYFESSGMVPAEVEMEVVDLSPSPIDSLERGTLRLSKADQEQQIDFLVSRDGRWFLRVDAVDLTVDPIARVVDAIQIGPDDPFLGRDDAPVTIVEYSDFQCPYCARAEEVVKKKVLEEYGDRVRFVYKQLPLVEIHRWAEQASAIGLCVLRYGGNDAYWEYHAAVFAKQRDIETDGAEKELLKLAYAAPGAVPEKIQACYESRETEEVLLAIQREANALGINSTPTFFINGRRLSGAQPLEAFKAIIDPALKSG